MRQIILDTETTGLNANAGDRLIEIGCVEMVNRRLTGRRLHYYVHPERDIPEEAIAVHGITLESLIGKPKFAEIAHEIREFVQDAELIIHNAAFDMGFLEMEFQLAGLPSFRQCVGGVVDTLREARQMFPGKRNSLDALCDRLGVSNAHRTLHGALLDAELLAEVYLAMTRGQNSLVIDMIDTNAGAGVAASTADLSVLTLPVLLATDDELTAHASVLKELDKASGGKTVWKDMPGEMGAPMTAPASVQ
ncbi:MULTISPECIES: DNA polymerase III subunit epsilon [Cupriavidus]|uniref:DNA polymerase III subunit epsilon n=1 Tax=Cupriavidus pauculus TaxID=82633 RepID=A0A5P2GZT6_9BURK|nr:DNA polymerase III subunit epsilon [Cupriavidus pauculus]QET01162.1 DNA polymerase III subunit epsilon [Cupriavidus pauculus]